MNVELTSEEKATLRGCIARDTLKFKHVLDEHYRRHGEIPIATAEQINKLRRLQLKLQEQAT